MSPGIGRHRERLIDVCKTFVKIGAMRLMIGGGVIGTSSRTNGLERLRELAS